MTNFKKLSKVIAVVVIMAMLCSLFAACGKTVEGPQGPQGEKGEIGATGATGAQGDKGEQGEKGDKGDAGEDGKDGVDGEDGKDGLTPYIGENGNWWIGETDTGIKASAVDGEDGKDGADGKDGVDGEDGKDGAPGKDGVDGEDGKDGAPGKDGVDGEDGKDGADGKDGVDGEDGKDGAPGKDGADGEDGKDGAPGKDGVDGEDGKDGADGEDGKDGLTPYIGSNGNWWIGDKDTGVAAKGEAGEKGETGATGAQGDKGDKGDTGAQGEKGETGDKGDKGDTGADGLTPHIGTNGNWWIGDKDTGVAAKGDTGATGEKGETGAQGPQGDKGDKGDTGDKGDKGDKGDTGADGADGEKGDTGLTGFVVNELSELKVILEKIPNAYIIFSENVTLTADVTINVHKNTNAIVDYNFFIIDGASQFKCTFTGGTATFKNLGSASETKAATIEVATETNTPTLINEVTVELPVVGELTEAPTVTIPQGATFEQAATQVEVKIEAVEEPTKYVAPATGSEPESTTVLVTNGELNVVAYKVDVVGLAQNNTGVISLQFVVGAGLSNVQVWHNDKQLTAENTCNADTFNYDKDTGIVTVYTKDFSQFTIASAKDTSAAVAQIGETLYYSVADAIAAVQNDETIVLLKDVNDPIVFENIKVTLDLNGKTVEMLGAGQCAIRVKGESVVTITGNGTVNGGTNGSNVAVRADTGAVVYIENGTYTVGCDENNEGNSVIYAAGGSIFIKGGVFYTDYTYAGKYYVLNLKNGSGGSISVSGGKFKNFNPAGGDDNVQPTNFVAEGYQTTYGNYHYEVVPATGFYYVLDISGESYNVQSIDQSFAHGETVTIPTTFNGKPVTGITDGAFYENSTVKKVVIPEGITYIGLYVFSLSGIEEVCLPATTQTIELGAFEECTALTTVTYAGTKEQWEAIKKEEGWCKNPSFTVVCTDDDYEIKCPAGHTQGESFIETPHGCTQDEITVVLCTNCDNAFDFFVSKPASHTKNENGVCTACNIMVETKTDMFGFTLNEDSASYTLHWYHTKDAFTKFENEPTIGTSVVVPKEYQGYAITVIGKYAFALYDIVRNPDEGEWSVLGSAIRFPNVDTIVLQDNIVEIGDYAFAVKRSGIVDPLTEVLLPNTITTIGSNAFAECVSLTTIRYNGTTAQWEAIEKADNWNGGQSFTVECTDGNIAINKGEFELDQTTDTYIVSGIGTWVGTVINIPTTYEGKAVTGIKDNAFSGSSVQTVAVPVTVTNIGANAFAGCKSLRQITYGGTKAQWKAIVPELDYDDEKPTKALVICTDGSMCAYHKSTDFYSSHSYSESCSVCGGVRSLGLAFEMNSAGTGYIVSLGTCTDNEIYIPGTYIGMPVVEIAEEGFANNTNIEYVELPPDITFGKFAFSGCIKLSKIKYCGSDTSWSMLESVSGSGIYQLEGCYIYFSESLNSDGTPNEIICNEHNYVDGVCDFCNEAEE